MAAADPTLTIVVPAWQPRYLRAALASIAAQTDTRFVCHVFDDAGATEVASICADFPAFRYTRFATNLGGQSLVAHWNRCLAQVDTPWVWLFSDDDVMQPGCVAQFHAARERQPACRVHQFAVDMVDAELASVLWHFTPAPVESVATYLDERFAYRRLSCLPDHVFHWHTLRDLAGGIVDLPLAWNADDATWVLLGLQGGIGGIPGAKVLWRQSAQNISNARHLRWQKLGADLDYLHWLAARDGLPAQALARAPRWLGTRLARTYGFGLADLPRLLRTLPLRDWTALAWALGVGLRDRLRPAA